MSAPGVMPFVALGKAGLVAFTSTRQGGVSPAPYLTQNLGLHVGDDPALVLRNRESLWKAQGLENRAKAVCLRQVHGTRIVAAHADMAGAGWESHDLAVPEADGCATNEPDLMLTIGHADCLALVLADPVRRAVGVAHAGWRGALGGIAENLVLEMAALFNSRPADLLAGISPNLHACCLRLGVEQWEAFSARWPKPERWASQVDAHGFNLSLNALVSDQLVAAGLELGNIEIQDFCTGCNPALFYSHRRDRGTTGRMWTVAGFLSHPPKPKAKEEHESMIDIFNGPDFQPPKPIGEGGLRS